MPTTSRSQAFAPASSEAQAHNTERAFPFLDLKAQFATIREEVQEAIARVMESQHFILGKEVQSFESEVAALMRVPAAVSCGSGSDALLLSLMALGVGPGWEVVTTPFTFVATVGSIMRLGAKPVFVDILPDTFNLNPDQLEASTNSSTRAIMPVHLFGLSSDMDRILKIASAGGWAVIEDAAQAIGALYHGRHVGSLGTTGCFSFFPSKNLGGAGDGGLITTNDPKMADRLRVLRTHGSRTKYRYEMLGMNSRLDALQAAILRAKLSHLEAWTEGRRRNADNYRALFSGMGLCGIVQLPVEGPGYFHVYNQFTIRAPDRDRLREFLTSRGIPTEIYYPSPLHLQPAFSDLGYKEGQFSAAETAAREVLSLPIYPELKEEQQLAVVQAIADFYGSHQ
jgi:dTDP-4-amino-4,6-dideoxygalactose transaminase